MMKIIEYAKALGASIKENWYMLLLYICLVINAINYFLTFSTISLCGLLYFMLIIYSRKISPLDNDAFLIGLLATVIICAMNFWTVYYLDKRISQTKPYEYSAQCYGWKFVNQDNIIQYTKDGDNVVEVNDDMRKTLVQTLFDTGDIHDIYLAEVNYKHRYWFRPVRYSGMSFVSKDKCILIRRQNDY